MRLVLTLWLALAAAPALAVGPTTSPLDDHPTYQRARAHIKAGEYAQAIPLLTQLRGEMPEAADVYNWLGFAHRKLKNYPQAKIFYDRALALEPSHLGANEYLGEWYVETGDLPKARERLETLRRLCGTCEEAEDLAKAIAAATP
jgi:tetratricopeptide (TPR) repeat protein